MENKEYNRINRGYLEAENVDKIINIDKIIRDGQDSRVFKRHASASDHADNTLL